MNVISEQLSSARKGKGEKIQEALIRHHRRVGSGKAKKRGVRNCGEGENENGKGVCLTGLRTGRGPGR